ncbi:hypothetical protein HETIRDRAFT_444676 [Heterobasidion irregulare TC 32-1]|uniref:5'-3' exoribonuclease 1 n=1 Tax=Heterobasidion irregulare (strain TC 32-1) TaxID=747525 RepID=W4KBZ3_HETIT|nr:uncharacterized protein HETIRDRAFT_444676 [Heterobasidion irregulare TC 32-1]ETW83387.1 hypothetical protein HETIRDRAFT_444676 [Heterobasidion irregulare TC 32-1]
MSAFTLSHRERYPLTSQIIEENKIPEFDNLYLDFNGIIHSCSHPNDDDAHFRLSEEQIFTSIFAYVDHLFGKIKPKKLFFMAVDGVAPRAKMNQQRSRRFRTAKEAKEVREKALSKGEKLPDEKAFDSNCITPGTMFMAKLSEQLRYFVNKKISEDSNWRDIQVVLSGHEVPGEGEHKIMEYIRLSKAQPEYNPNVRHCLYGLDADLIMLGGYLNDSGLIDTKRLQVILDEMAQWEQEVFEKEYADLNWYKGKQSKNAKELEHTRNKSKLVLTPSQRSIFDSVKAFVLEHRGLHSPAQLRNARLDMPNTFPARDRTFITDLANDLHLELTWDEYDENDQNLVTFRFPGALEPPLPTDDAGDENDEEWESEEDEEATEAVDRVLKKYAKAKVSNDEEDGDFDTRHDRSVKAKMDEWKKGYYVASSKLEIDFHDPEQIGALVHRYVEGLHGVASWSWFYDYHYAPRVSDLKGVDKMSFTFELGKPFRPFEQLMGVLPEASKELIPTAFQDLMSNSESPILDFYPQEFEQDLNGKKQEWEAVVKIPFIDQERLLRAMASREHRLTREEQQRNSYGTSYQFKHNPGEPVTYPSSLPGFFPPIYRCTCIMEPFDLPTLDGLHLVQGLCDGVFLGTEALAGFPSLKTLPHTAMLGHHGVNVHGSESRNKSMVIHIENTFEGKKSEDIARELIGKKTFIGWPFLQEGMVAAVSNSLFKYEKMSIVQGGPQKVVGNPHSQQGLAMWKSKAERITYVYSKKCGVIPGDIDILLHVRPLKGLKRLESGALVKDYEDYRKEVEQAVQLTVSDVVSEDPRFLERKAPPLSEEFPEKSKIFFLGEHAYGVAAQVSATTEDALSVILVFSPTDKTENEKFKEVVTNRSHMPYYPSFQVAEKIGVSGRALSRITSSFMVLTSDNQKVNLGLSLKFEGKGMKVLDYSRKSGGGGGGHWKDRKVWEFSDKAVDLLQEYKAKFPEVFLGLDRNGDDMVKAEKMFSKEADPDARAKSVRTWLASKGVRDFEPVSLDCDQLGKSTVEEIEKLANTFNQNRSATFKKAIVKGIPRQAVLKPAHAVYRLQNQHFAIGDRVTMVQDSGGVPLAVKGVVIGLNEKNMDVVWDHPFMSGTTLSNRCTQYRGSTVEFNTCLNLTNPQFITSVNPKAPPPADVHSSFAPRPGPHSVPRPAPGQQSNGGFRPPALQTEHPVHIMTNPNRGRGPAAGPAARHRQRNAPERRLCPERRLFQRTWGLCSNVESFEPSGEPMSSSWIHSHLTLRARPRDLSISP